METIFALASAQGRAGVAVIRISGPEAFGVAKALCGPLPVSHYARIRRVCDPAGELIDEALVVPFEEGKSFTGEQTVELHLHGSIAIVKRVLSVLSDMPMCRMAEPGEFTRRAMENERLDLSQVEGLSDLIEAETEAQRRQAQRVFSGDLGERVDVWRSKLIRAAALLEATIDFADEEVPVDVTPEVEELLGAVRTDLEKEIAGSSVAERVRNGFEVAILGAPNVGKSTLLNALAGREAAITSEIAGTTRDVIEVRMDLRGRPVVFLDTAGLRGTDDVIESIGIARAVERANLADLRLVLSEDGVWPDEVTREADDILLAPKDDDGVKLNGISGRSGVGISNLLESVTRILVDRAGGAGIAIRERHRLAFTDGLTSLSGALTLLESGPERYDLVAEELRSSARVLSSLIGRVDVEGLLDEIFSSFCIGK